MKKISSLLMLVVMCQLFVSAQTFSPERTGGVYYAYPVTVAQRVKMPAGYEPFYISHYGRHGSRWLPSEERYEWVMAQFSDKENLTPLGRKVRRQLKTICRNARGKAGQLTPLGVQQHRQIARRMATNYPEAFRQEEGTDDIRILARSSTSPRCRASMLAFCKELETQTKLQQAVFTIETKAEHMAYINHEPAGQKALSSRIKGVITISPERFVRSLFKDLSKLSNPTKLLSELHTIASDMQDIPLTVSLWDIFTEEEMLAVHDANTRRMTICNGDTPLNDGIAARSSIPLWQNIECEADSMIASGGRGASLRFGHDTALYRLLTLLQLELPGTGMEDIVPMAANLQMIFCRSEQGKEPLVLFLLNERPVTFRGLSHVAGSFYSWYDIKKAMHERLHQLEHLRQLSTLNTMVGTDQANTHTAGIFGKGSEEKGQTLPAVLVPNGQTFWTPQTQQTEQKCISPYYYRDTLFQGIRASHWLVGGCTQDYGSFTVAAYRNGDHSGKGTPFCHDEEISHPYYYAVNLPEEQLQLELTALSHGAILRITPQDDGPVSIVVSANSDEQEGGVELDREHRLVYGFNPVHRIYQGWGERAGFSGHFVLKYTDELLNSEREAQSVCLTFMGRRHQPIVLRMATSFTSREGAGRNMQQEAACTFEQMEEQCIRSWSDRLHTIDVEDADTARVDQFYGALYRSSFLPREMSDCDGSYPRFASGETIHPSSSSCKRYGDFSMWDTYRALHPLLCIIAAEESGQMMRSLVGMAEEGGWLPIFPCWNSYTAAMIGDHCSSVLADAYVKGIRGFDAQKAYLYMRKNAFLQPATFEEYKDGMGRRALQSYLDYGYIPLEDSVKEAFHQQEQTSRTLEYAYDDFCVAQMAKALGHEHDYDTLMKRSGSWRHVINPQTGYADGRHADGSWEGNTDLVHRQPYITEGATCHYTWYVPHQIPDLITVMGGGQTFVQKLDSMFDEGRYWHGNEPCHQVAWLYSLAGHPEKTRQRVSHILQTEYNNSPGGLSGNDDAGQMSAWQVFASIGFYPVCPATTQYVLGGAQFRQVTLNMPKSPPFIIRRAADGQYRLNGKVLETPAIDHSDLKQGGELLLP
ncbi:MAG: GH92 family glycosyl hydrolase [Prevotella sp.]|nr:GH92 family glycosyl hydrolase [Prevotella sp.]